VASYGDELWEFTTRSSYAMAAGRRRQIVPHPNASRTAVASTIRSSA
jgi:hypothetical protein